MLEPLLSQILTKPHTIACLPLAFPRLSEIKNPHMCLDSRLSAMEALMILLPDVAPFDEVDAKFWMQD